MFVLRVYDIWVIEHVYDTLIGLGYTPTIPKHNLYRTYSFTDSYYHLIIDDDNKKVLHDLYGISKFSYTYISIKQFKNKYEKMAILNTL